MITSKVFAHSGHKVNTYIIATAKGPRCVQLSEANIEQILSKVADLCENVADEGMVESSIDKLVEVAESFGLPK